MVPTGTRIAHISDVHMLDTSPSGSRRKLSLRHRFLSFGRPLDSDGRRRRLLRSLAQARSAGADRVVISGDLTEVGIPEEFVSLGEALRESGFAPERITLVPGNHDLYSSADAWKWAIRGPLSEFEASSATEPGRIIECVGANIMPMDATIHQPVMRSAGFLSDEALDVMDRRASDPGLANKPLIIVQHHPPFLLGTCAWQWIDGLTGSRRLMAMMRAYRHLVVMHGHLHTLVTRAVGDDVPRILGATAVVEDLAMSRVRIFDCRDGQVRCVTSSNESASEPTWSSVGLASFGSVGISES